MKHPFLISASFAVLLAISPAARAQDAAAQIRELNAKVSEIETSVLAQSNNGAYLSDPTRKELSAMKADAAEATTLLAKIADANKSVDTAKAEVTAGQQSLNAATQAYQTQAKQVEIKLDILDGLKKSYKPEAPQKALTEAIAQQKTQEYWFNEAAKAVDKANRENLPADHPFRKEAEAGFANAQRLLVKAQTAASLAADVVTDPKNGLAKLQAAQQEYNDAKASLDKTNSEKNSAAGKVNQATATLNQATTTKDTANRELEAKVIKILLSAPDVTSHVDIDVRKATAKNASSILKSPAVVPALAADANKGLAPQAGSSNPGALLANNASPVVAAGGGNVVAAGGGNVVAAGGGNVVAAGGGNVVAAGGGNVLASNAAPVVAAGGGNVVAAGAGNVVAAGGGNVVAAGGGNVVAAGGGNIASPRYGLNSLSDGNAAAAQVNALSARIADLDKAADTAKADLDAGQKRLTAAESAYQAQAKIVETKRDTSQPGAKLAEAQQALTAAVAEQKTQTYWFNEAAKAVEKANKEKLPADNAFRKQAEAGLANAQNLKMKAESAVLAAADTVKANGLDKAQERTSDYNTALAELQRLNREKTAANDKITLANQTLDQVGKLKATTSQELDTARKRAAAPAATANPLIAATTPALAPDAGKGLAVQAGAPNPGALLANNASPVVAAGGGNVVATKTGALVSHDGGSLISDKGAGLVSHDGGSLVSQDGSTAIARNATSFTRTSNIQAFTNDTGGAVAANQPQGNARTATTSPASASGSTTAPAPAAPAAAAPAASALPLTGDSQAFGRLAVMATDPELKSRLGNMANGQKTLGELVAVLQSGKQLSATEQQKVQAMWIVSTDKLEPSKVQGLDQQVTRLGSAVASTQAAHVEAKTAMATAVVQKAVQAAKTDPIVASAAQKLTTNQTLTPAETKSLNAAVAKTVNGMGVSTGDKKALTQTTTAHVTTLVATNAATAKAAAPNGNTPAVGAAGRPAATSPPSAVQQPPKAAAVVTTPPTVRVEPKPVVQQPPKLVATTPSTAPVQVAKPAPVAVAPVKPPTTAVVAKPPVIQAAPPPPPPKPPAMCAGRPC